MVIPGFLLRHRVTVEPFLGNSATGPRYGTPTEVRCWLEEKTRVVVAPTGEKVASSATFWTLPDAVCPPKSRVTLPSGRKTLVIGDAQLDSGGLPAPSHLEVHLQ